MLIEHDNHVLRLALLRFGDSVPVYILEHPSAQAVHRRLHTGRHGDLRLVKALVNNIMYHCIETLPDTVPENIRIFRRQIFFLENLSPDRVVNIMVNIGYLIGKTDDMSTTRTLCL